MTTTHGQTLPYDTEDWRRLAREFKTGTHCGGIITHDGIEDACGKPPVAIIDGRGTEDESFWTACAYHAHRWGRGRCVPLSVLLAAALMTAHIEDAAQQLEGLAS